MDADNCIVKYLKKGYFRKEDHKGLPVLAISSCLMTASIFGELAKYRHSLQA